MFRHLLIASVVVFLGCGRGNSAPGISVLEILGGPTQRVERVTAILGKHKTPPTAIHDAHFIQEQTGGTGPKPSASRTFCVIELALPAVAQWSSLLTPLTRPPEYAAPARSRDWWVSRDAFSSLQFCKPEPFTGRTNGWTAISPKTGRIYFFTFTK